MDILKTEHHICVQNSTTWMCYFFPQTLKQDMAQEQKENSQLKSQSQKEEAELKILTEAVHR